MALALRDIDPTAARTLADLASRVDSLERMPSGRNSIGVDKIMPCVKAGTPVDGDFLRVPPVGTAVYDTTNSKWWVRHSAGVWKGVVVA